MNLNFKNSIWFHSGPESARQQQQQQNEVENEILATNNLTYCAHFPTKQQYFVLMHSVAASVQLWPLTVVEMKQNSHGACVR